MTKPNSGVYILRHRPTGKLYVGASNNLATRELHWKMALQADPKRLQTKLRELLPFSDDDWEFHIVCDGTGMSLSDLQETEQRAIDHVRARAPEKLLNTDGAKSIEVPGLLAGGRTLSIRGWEKETGVKRATIHARLKAGWSTEQAVGLQPRAQNHAIRGIDTMMSAQVLVVKGGEVLSQAEAAAALGCQVKTLAARLRQFRVPGRQVKITLGQLKVRTREYRR